MRIDLKALLLISMSTAPDHVVHMRKRIKCGKVSYLVSYELQSGHLTIRQVKRSRTTPTLTMRLRQRRRRLQRRLKRGITSLDTGSQTSQSSQSIAVGTEKPNHKSIAVGTSLPGSNSKSMQAEHSTADAATETRSQERRTVAVGTENIDIRHCSVASGSQAVQLETSATQTPCREWAISQVDTFDLILTMSRDQQTLNLDTQSSVCQTEEQVQMSCATQVEVKSKSSTTQTNFRSSSAATQTALCHFTNSSVQTVSECQHVVTQTFDDEDVMIRPHVQALYLIHNSIKNQNDIIHNEVLEAINQLMDVTLLGFKKRCWEDEASFGLKKSVRFMDHYGPTPEAMISSTKQQKETQDLKAMETELKEPSSKLESKYRIGRFGRGKRLAAGQSWYCTKRCKQCGLHMHRTWSKIALPTEYVAHLPTRSPLTPFSFFCLTARSHGTQTEDNTKVVESGLDVATQTEKERGRWKLRRS
ncbi:hypothetical protein KR067_005247 [Drosophila pandora]|nr:hypothetical protein KR067_005247 [Drosophila pandora]